MSVSERDDNRFNIPLCIVDCSREYDGRSLRQGVRQIDEMDIFLIERNEEVIL